jgi:uroporphyrinogen III methyltransferase/synthase
LPEELTKMGAKVDEIITYCTEAISDDTEILLNRLEEGSIDMVTFTSSSTAKNFHALLPSDRLEMLMRGVIIASIGPITADTAKALGFKVNIIAETYTIPGLCEAIQNYYKPGL